VAGDNRLKVRERKSGWANSALRRNWPSLSESGQSPWAANRWAVRGRRALC